ncbi:PAS domain S-box protein [Anaerolineales bacterium HSG25]|nr:PAS domain S-box protein [Anaerolineales bacterium HSG25]
MIISNERPNILVIDDNAANVRFLMKSLEVHGYMVTTARNGTMGLRRAKFVQPDLILLDVMMPDIDGFEVYRRLKQDTLLKEIPVIFLTAKTEKKDVIDGLKLGAVDYVTKPFETAEVLARVETHLTINNLRKQLEEKNRQLEAETAKRKQTETELHRNKQDLARAHNMANLGNFRYDLRTGDVVCSREFSRMIGLGDEEQILTLEQVDALIHPADLLASQQAFQNVLDGDNSAALDIRIVRPDGSIRHFHDQFEPVYDDHEQVVEIFGTIQDITKRKQLELNLVEKTIYFNNVLQSTTEYSIITTDLDLRIIYYNPLAEKLFGYTAAEVIGRTVQEIHIKENVAPERFERGIENVRNGGEHRYTVVSDHEGKTRYVSSRVSGIYDTESELVGFALFSRDVSQREQAKETIKQKNQFLHTIIESLDNPFYVINVKDYSIEIANSAARKKGITRMNTCYALTHRRDSPCDSMEHPCPLAIIRQTKKSTTVEHIHYDKDGKLINVEVHGYPIFNDEGEIIQMIEYSIDITKRKQVEEQIRKLSRAVEQSGSTVVITDLDGAIEFVNPAFSKITGYSHEEAMGQNPRVLKSGKMSPELYHELWTALSRGEVWQGEMINRKKNGDLYWEYATISPVKDDVGQTTHYLAIKDDITERKRVEEALQKTHDELELRVDELGTLNLIMQTLTVAELNSALQTIAQIIAKLFSAYQCGIALLNDDRTELIVIAEYTQGSNKSNATSQSSIRILVAGNPATIQAIEDGVSLVVPQPQTNPLTVSMQELMRERNSQCFLIVPLLVRGKAIGTIGIHTDQVEREFTLDEVKLTETIAGQIAGAIENSRLFEAEKKAREASELANASLSKTNQHLQILNDQMYDELSLAREIQYSLLPSPRPDWSQLEVACFTTPASEIGGDFYTYHKFEDGGERIVPLRGGFAQDERKTILKTSILNRYAVVVGDVSGKGVSAALLMAASLSQLEAMFVHNYPPAERLAYLDEAIMHYTKPRRQNCAMCYVEIEERIEDRGKTLKPARSLPVGGQSSILYPLPSILTVVNAGCIPPYIKRADGSVEFDEEMGGFALGQGLGAMLGYQQHTVELFSGDMVILTSDGVVEANNDTDEMLGFDRLMEIVKAGPTDGAEAMLEHLKRDVFAFTEGADQHDDMTMVVVRV